MSQPHSTSKSGPRRRNRNRNQRGPGRSSHSGHSNHSHGTKSHAPKKPSLAQRLLGMIGLGKKTAPAKAAAPSSGKVTRESIPARQQSKGPAEARTPRPPREPRKPEVVEVTNPRLYIGNLSYDASETDLEEIFNGVGRVLSVEIVTNSRTQRSKGYGFVEMGSVDEAKRAVETLHDKEVMGRKMVVSGAKPKDESRSEA
ncbi:MAG: RNA recognition motif domain-containing protein [Verrucomicrobiales bacterium]